MSETADERIKRWATLQRLACEKVNARLKAEREELESLPDFGSLSKESEDGQEPPCIRTVPEVGQ